jgi:hypothetical protein
MQLHDRDTCFYFTIQHILTKVLRHFGDYSRTSVVDSCGCFVFLVVARVPIFLCRSVASVVLYVYCRRSPTVVFLSARSLLEMFFFTARR